MINWTSVDTDLPAADTDTDLLLLVNDPETGAFEWVRGTFVRFKDDEDGTINEEFLTLDGDFLPYVTHWVELTLPVE